MGKSVGGGLRSKLLQMLQHYGRRIAEWNDKHPAYARSAEFGSGQRNLCGRSNRYGEGPRGVAGQRPGEGADRVPGIGRVDGNHLESLPPGYNSGSGPEGLRIRSIAECGEQSRGVLRPPDVA